MWKTLEQLLIERDQVDRIYTGSMPLYLWRALHKTVITPNPYYPDFERREIRPGQFRAPDVTVRNFWGTEYVIARLREGTSLFDKPNAFPGKSWSYFEIPAGTEVPAGLIITKDEFNTRFGATHYSISPNRRAMTKSHFCLLLDHLANNANRRKRELIHG